MKKKLLTASACCAALASAAPTFAADNTPNELIVPMEVLDVEEGNRDAGNVHIMMTEYGALFVAALNDVEPGVYGFHVHETGSFDAKEVEGKLTAGMAAGGHWAPANTAPHPGSSPSAGHSRALPALAIHAAGTSYAVLGPWLRCLPELPRQAPMSHWG